MANPLLNGMNPQNGGNPMGNMFNMISNFQKFKQNFIGDPKQQVQELLNSGRMTQEQFDYLQNMAKSLSGILK